MEYTKLERVMLADNETLNEKWVQKIIAEDPSILGLGDLVLKDKERTQPNAGRLDLLLQDPDSDRRYEVELQLGRTDETHIIRTIEYWDVERKRYPQYDHTAVIIAEDITSRFLNVINLFNGYIPLIALQMSALKVGNQVSLIFTKVLDQVTLGPVDEDEVEEVTDRAYWEKRGTKQTVKMADELLILINEFAPDLHLKYNKFYIGLAKDGQPNNFVTFQPQKNALRLLVYIKRDDKLEKKLTDSGLDLVDYDVKWGCYRIRLTESAISEQKDLLKELMQKSSKE